MKRGFHLLRVACVLQWVAIAPFSPSLAPPLCISIWTERSLRSMPRTSSNSQIPLFMGYFDKKTKEVMLGHHWYLRQCKSFINHLKSDIYKVIYITRMRKSGIILGILKIFFRPTFVRVLNVG